MSIEIEWAEPPATDAAEADEIAAALRANPGRWARIKTETTDNGMTTRVRNGVTKAWRPAGEFDARAVSVGRVEDVRLYDIYVRYVGAGESA